MRIELRISGLLLLCTLIWAAACNPADPKRAAALVQQGRQEEAAGMVEGWTPSTPQEWGLLARIYRGLPGYEDRAVEIFTPLAETGDAEAVLLAARIAADADRPTLAVEWLEAGMERHPYAAELAIELSKTYGRLRRFEEAAAVLQPGSERDPRKLNLIGYALLLSGDRERAESYFRDSIAAARSYGSDFAPPHYHLGLLHRMRGDLESALAEQIQAIEVNRDHLEAHYQAMAVAERLGRTETVERVRKGFERLYRPRLEKAGSFDDIYAAEPEGGIDRRLPLEHRIEAEGAEFRRSFAGGSSVEFACLAPPGECARFEVEIDGAATGPTVYEHAGAADDHVWFPHRIDLPGGEDETGLTFRILPCGSFSRWIGSDPPAGAAFSEPAADPASGIDPAGRPNILLVSLDTLRADRLGSYGNERATSAAIDRLAADGVRFERAEAASNWTLPSHYSLFSGLPPVAHGVTPSLYALPGYLPPRSRMALRGSGREVMLAEVLSEAGYRTAAVTEGGWVSGRFGFDQGFRIYRSAPVEALPGTLLSTLDELERHADREPWFLFVHTYATHQPYHAPEEYRARWADAGHRGIAWPEARVPIAEYNRFHQVPFAPAPSDVAAFRDLYDGQVAWADDAVSRIVADLESRGLAERTLVVVTSDHGEEIFERNAFNHGDTLYEEVTRVPLVLHMPGRIPAGVVVRGPVSLVDLPATLLDIAGIAEELGQGRSLRPLWELPTPVSDRTVFAHAVGDRNEPIYAVWRDRFKLILRETDAGTEELCFDLESDPGEIRPLAGTARCERNGLPTLLERHLLESENLRQELGPVEDGLDRRMLESLRNLGYID